MLTINLNEKFRSFSDRWSPKILGEVNDCAIKAAKLKGEFIWHHHEHEDRHRPQMRPQVGPAGTFEQDAPDQPVEIRQRQRVAFFR